MYQKGFTLIELVIVFSIIALLSVGGLASFVIFSQRQLLKNANADFHTMLNVARTNTLSQYNDACTSSQQFGGYLVVVCCRTTGDPNNPLNESPAAYCPDTGCSGSYDYELYQTCINGNGTATNTFVNGKTLPSGVVITRQTTARMFQFAPITGNVTYGTQGNSISSGTVEFYLQSNKGERLSTTVSSIGTIQ